MGYTHYWKHPEIPAEDFALIKSDAAKLFAEAEKLGIPLGNWAGEEGTSPEAVEDEIGFNGVEPLGYETLVIRRRGTKFSFCKTARRPYDIIVQAILIILQTNCPEAEVSSDGMEEDWQDARALCERLFWYGKDFVLSK